MYDLCVQTYGRVLHPQHAHMLDIKFSLLNLLGHSEGATLSQVNSGAALSTPLPCSS